MQEIISKRTRNSKTFDLGGRKRAWDGSIGSIHYSENGEWLEIDNIFEPALAPWDWQMLRAEYHIRVKEDFTAGQIIEFEKQGEIVQFQPMALEWTNDLDQIQPIAMPQSVTPTVTNPEVALLPAVGMPSHQGIIKWNDAYGDGLDFEWRCTSTRLVKILEIENLNKLPVPEQYILDGGNPVLRLNLIFDPSSGVDIYVDGELWNKTTKKQTFNTIEFRKDGEVLWGFMPLRYWGSNPGNMYQPEPETYIDDDGETYTVPSEPIDLNNGQSVATLEKRGNSLYISIRVPYDWLQSAVYPVFIDTNVDEQVVESTDDLYSSGGSAGRSGSSAITLTSTSGYIGSAWYNIAVRFQSVAVPNGSNISVAYMQFIANAANSGLVNSVIYGEDIDNALTFADVTEYKARVSTSAAIDWDGIPAWSVDEESPDTKTSDISTIIKEIIDRPGWAEESLVLFCDTKNTSEDYRRAYLYDSGDGLEAPKLHIEYEAAWTGKFCGVTNPSKILGVPVSGISKVMGVA